MMVANSFDLWQKDAFFSAAEEVQESADIMESAYRLWVKEKRDGRAPEELDEFCRNLQTALGTAKWQLEEFERAVSMSHSHCRDDTTSTRHKQFVAAIENQIYRVESALHEAFSEEGKQPLRWVNLNEEERDDLAMFLSGTSQSSQRSNSGSIESRNFMKSFQEENPLGTKEAEISSKPNRSRDTSKDIRSNDNNSECIIDIEERESPGSGDARIRQTDKTAGTRRTWSSPNFSALRIIVPGEEEEEKNAMIGRIEATPKEKGYKPLFWLQRYREYNRAAAKPDSLATYSPSSAYSLLDAYAVSFIAICIVLILRTQEWFRILSGRVTGVFKILTSRAHGRSYRTLTLRASQVKK